MRTMNLENIESFIPQNREELTSLVGKPVAVQFFGEVHSYVYFGYSQHHELIKQHKCFFEKLRKFSITECIDTWMVPDAHLQFSNEGIILPNEAKIGGYDPDEEEYSTRLKMLQENKIWRKPEILRYCELDA